MGVRRSEERSAPSLRLIVSLAIAFLLGGHAAQGVTKTKLVPADAQAEAFFGASVALDGDTVVVGAHEQANFQGAVYVFVRDQSGWVQQAKLTGDADVSDFGLTVSIRGDDLIVGAGAGRAYVYHRTGTAWSKQATLVPKAGWIGLTSAAISGDYAVVLLPLIGGGHVFKRSGSVWAKQGELPMDCVDVVSIDLDYILIGCGGAPAQVFKRIGNLWLPQATLTGTGDGHFGHSVSINGVAIVSEPFTNQVDEAIYIFQKNGSAWTPTKFGSPSPGLDSFGYSASISPHHALAGKPKTTSYDIGGAYLYRRNGSSWSMSETLTSGVANDHFGYAVAVSDERAVVGAPSDSSTFPHQGAAYVFEELGVFLDVVVGLWSELSVPNIEIGCEIIDCCPGCPGPPYELDWQIRLNGPILEAAELWFPTLSPDASRRMRVEGNASWVGVNRLRVGKGKTVLRGFSVNPKLRAPVAIPTLLLDESAVRSLTSEKGWKELGRLELVVEQMLGRVVVSEYRFTYDVDEALRSAPKLQRDTARIEKPRSR